VLRNHLDEQTSPYLLQHADHPVDWYPWGDAAWKPAKHDNKPSLLSRGIRPALVSCHGTPKSFEDPGTAA